MSAVQAAATELHYAYRPRRSQPLPSTTPTIAVISQRIPITSDSNPFYSPVIRGAERACSASETGLLFAVVDRQVTRHEQLPALLRERRVQGLMVVSYIHPDTLATLQCTGLPIVLVDHAVDVPGIDSVMADDDQGGYLATRLLIERGHRHPVPAMIVGPLHVSIQRRVAGYRRALAEFGLAHDQRYVRASLDPDGGYAAMVELLDQPVPPTAVFCCNDTTALGALDALHDRDIAVPRQCSVVGYDDIEQAAHACPPLTTIGVDKELLGNQAVRFLLDRIAHPMMTARYTRLGVRLIHRESVGPSPLR